jgi:Outer membrane protein beta-barrel domain
MRHRARSPSLLTCVAGLVLLVVVPAAVFAQSATRPRVGLGVSVSDVGELVVVGGTGSTSPSVITPTILVPINVTSRFRVEPQVGFYWNSAVNTTSVGTQTQTETRTSSVLHVGSGVFGLTSTERFTVYYGGRVAYLRVTQSDVTGSSPNAYTYPTAPGYFVAPVVGGEYFLSDHLSLGGEVQVRYTSSTFDANANNRVQSNITSKTASTHGAFVLRFYFGG